MQHRNQGWRDFFAEGAVIFFLWGFAVAQPLFDLLARRAEFFVVRRSEPLDILLLAVIVSVLAPALLTLIEAVAGLLARPARQGLHHLFVAALIGAVVLQLCARLLPYSGWVHISLAITVATVCTVFYSRLRPSRGSFVLVVLSAGCLVFPIAFLLHPSISKLVLPAAGDVRPAATRVDATIPVVIVVFDELSVVSLMDERRQIDPFRYPNFASLAQKSTWYRNATTVSDNTVYAVPSMLTGKYPRHDLLPTAEDHPQNLFTWLGASYDLNVFESNTHLCPPDICRERSVSPRLAHRFDALFSDLYLVYCHILLPEDMVVDLPSVSSTWKDFGNRNSLESSMPESRGLPADKRIAKFVNFSSAIRSRTSRVLHYLHLSLPHTPWEFLPSGQRYKTFESSRYPHGLSGHFWDVDRWHSIQANQRYLLQLGFTDHLLGRLLAELGDGHLFERSLIIVTSDHGVSFRPGDNYRGLTETNYPDIMSVPLLIKYPEQDSGSIDDTNVQLIDIVPTVADVLDVKLPWSVDGKSALRSSSDPPDSRKTMYFKHAKERRVFEDHPEAKYAMLDTQIELFSTGADRDGLFAIGRFKELIGHRLHELTLSQAIEGRVELDGMYDLTSVDLDAPTLPTHIVGELEIEAATGITHLAIVVNGIVRAVTRTYLKGDSVRFSAMIPPSSLSSGRNDLEVFAIHSEGDGQLKLARLESWRRSYSLERVAERGEMIVSAEGRSFPIRRNGLIGHVDRAVVENGEMKIRGWAADLEKKELPEAFIFFADGEFLFAGRPNRNRPRLAKEFETKEALGGFDHGFPVRLITGVEGSIIRIFALSSRGYSSELNYPPGYRWSKRYKLEAMGVEVLRMADGSSLQLGSPGLQGAVNFAAISDGRLTLRGWTVDVESCGSSEDLAVFVNGKFLFRGTAREPREDIGRRYGEERMRLSGYRFRVSLNRFEVSDINEVRVFAISSRDTAAELAYFAGYPWNRYSLSVATDGVEESLVTPAGRSIVIIPGAFGGRVMPLAITAKGTRVRGWFVEAAPVGTPTTVAIFADGEFVHSGRAVIANQNERFRGSGEASRAVFRFEIPRRLLPEPSKAELRVFAISKIGYASELRLSP